MTARAFTLLVVLMASSSSAMAEEPACDSPKAPKGFDSEAERQATMDAAARDLAKLKADGEAAG